MKYEFAVCPKDEQDLASGHKRKKKGDIIAVKPSPWNWGTEEVKRYLIVVVDNLTQEEADLLCKPLYEDDIEPTDENPKTPIAKRKFAMDLDKIKLNVKADLDFTRLEDFSDAYQPLKDSNIVIDADETALDFDFIKNKYTGEFKKAKKK